MNWRRTLHWVERIPDARGSMFFLLTESIFDSIRGSARFRRVVEQLGLGGAGGAVSSKR